MAVARGEVVDIDVDPLADRTRRRRTLLRIGLPLGGVGLIIGFLLGIAVYADSANRAGVLGLSETLLRSLQDRISLQVSAYLEPAAHAALLAQTMLGRGGATGQAEGAHAFAASILQETPQVANVLFADGAGNFMLVRRAAGGLQGLTETKRILMAPGGRTVEWTTRDQAGAVIARRDDPSDPYDARTRDWFTGARGQDDVYWSGIYTFASERVPGITTAVHGPGADPDVVGMDIRLDALSQFLAGLQIGRTGQAYLVAASGEMVAGPAPTRIMRNRNGQAAPAKVEEVGDARLAGSWDHYRVQGPGTRVIDVEGARIISIVTPLASGAGDWLLVISVPEAEFSGFVGINSRRAGLLSLVVVALALGLAVLLVRQGLRADKADRAVAERSDAVRQQSAAFARLAQEAGHFAPDGTPPAALAETLAGATGARRVSLWRLLGAGSVLRCEDSFEPATDGHVVGLELSQQEVSELIAALARGEEVDAPDARRDRRSAALHGCLMAPLGSNSLLAVPVLSTPVLAAPTPAGGAGGVRALLGMLLLEDARHDAAARDIVRACAALIALRTPAGTAPVSAVVPAAAASPALDAVAEQPGDDAGLDAALAAPPPADLAVTVHARASVLVLRLPEAAIAGRDGGAADGASLAHRIASAVQEVAAVHAIPYVKMLGATVVAAAGYTGSSNAAEAARRLADAAIALREVCAGLFDAVDDPAEFRLGLDAGAVTGGMVGGGAAGTPALFNLWGDAFQGADMLATPASAGSIQAGEAAYDLLRQTFLFRPRGLFHRPGAGEGRSYVLAGRA